VRARGGPNPAARCARRALEVPGRVHGSTAAEKSSDEHCAVADARALLRLSAGTLDSRSSGPGACARRKKEGAGRRRRGGASLRSPAHGGAEENGRIGLLTDDGSGGNTNGRVARVVAELERAQARLERARARPSTPATASVAASVRAAAADAARAREGAGRRGRANARAKWDEARPISGRRPWRGPLARHRRPRGAAARRRRARGAPSLWPVGHDARGARVRTRTRAGGLVWAKSGLPVRAGLLLFLKKNLNLTQMPPFGKFKSFFMKSAQNKSCREF
jgi:hypothetical protein